MDTFVYSHRIRRALLGLLILSLAFSPLPAGHAAGSSRQNREGEERDRERDKEQDRFTDCLPIGFEDDARDQDDRRQEDVRDVDDHERGKENGNGRRSSRPECLPGGSSSGVARGDFNGDGFADLAIGVPGEDTPTGTQNSGAVNIIYGSATGLTGDGTVATPRFFSQNAVGIPGDGSETGDGFGSALAAGNFNGDLYSDLAIGVPSEDNDLADNSGRVVIIYGSANGLAAAEPNVLPAQTFDLADLDELLVFGDEEFGRALAWGDFNGDTVGDLAIGAPGLESYYLNPGGVTPSPARPPGGGVFVLFGISGVGLSAGNFQFLHIFTPEVDSNALFFENFGKRFGEALAAGNFDGDSRNVSDLAIGIPHDTLTTGSNISDSGSVIVEFGQLAVGLGNNTFPFDARARAQSGAQFGRTLAAGDFDGDGAVDLAVAAPLRNAAGGLTDAGEVMIVSNMDQLLGPFLPQFWEQSGVFPAATLNSELSGAGSPTEAGDRFGAAMAAGDFNGDGRSDLAIGSPTEDIAFLAFGTPRDGVFFRVEDAGAVSVIYGSSSGLSITERAAQLWHQGLFGAADLESGDQFGASLTAWNFGRNQCPPPTRPPSFPACFPPLRTADLAIGVPLEDLPVSGRSIENCGQVNVLYGSSGQGLTTANVQRWHQGSHPDLGGRETDDGFGAAVY